MPAEPRGEPCSLVRSIHKPVVDSPAPSKSRGTSKVSADDAEKLDMLNSNLLLLATLAAAGGALTLYIMRRRVRLGRRTPKF